MNLTKIGVKIFLEKGVETPLSSFVPVFHRWIQEDLLEGLLVDVTEYTHVHQGPGVLLIAHEANYSVDETDGKRGFLYTQKRTPEKSAPDHLKTAFRRALQACALLEREPALAGQLKFAPNHARVFINDRLEAPHGADSHGRLEESLNPFLNWLYDGEKYLLIPEKDPLKRTGFEVKVEKSPDLPAMLQKLNGN